mgnify:CR=1 FL=1
MKVIFEGLCPNCNGSISDERLLLGAPCKQCLPVAGRTLKTYSALPYTSYQVKIAGLLEKFGTLREYKTISELSRAVLEFEELFKKAVGSKLWSAQREWAKRVLKGVSFAITAPTGLGKTIFGMVMSLYLASKGKKAYIVLPSRLLVEQVLNKMEEFKEKTGLNHLVIIGYYAGIEKRKKEKFLESLNEGSFDIIVTSSRFITVNFDKISKYVFDFIFVDDVDSVLKSSKDIDKILRLLGIKEAELALAYKAIKLKRKAITMVKIGERQHVLDEIRRTRDEIETLMASRKIGVLVVSTATGKAKGERIKLFRELLKFTIGATTIGFRNIQDIYLERTEDVEAQVLKLVKKLGGGGLIFVGLDDGKSLADKLAESLRKAGIVVETCYGASVKPSVIRSFSDGDIDILIGMASYYGVLVRGIDLPHRIRYAIFTSIPRFKFKLEIKRDIHPFRLFVLLNELAEYMDKEDRKLADKLAVELKRTVLKLEKRKVDEVYEQLKKGIEGELSYYVNVCLKAIEFLSKVLRKKEVLKKLEKSPYLSIKEIEGQKYVLIPDVRTYIQGSGRTSRLYAGGVTKGISIVLCDDSKLLRGLIRQLSWRFEETRWLHESEVNWDELVSEVDEDRRTVKLIMEGKIPSRFKDLVKSALLIVESPHKAKVISSFFGKPAQREILGLKAYEVTTGDLTLNIVASKGHVFDLVSDKGFHGVLVDEDKFIPVYATIKRCSNCGEQFTDDVKQCPYCGNEDIMDSMDIIRALRELASEVDLVLIGTDPDVEGEKIGWDIMNALRPYVADMRRIEFHEVTRRGIRNALKNLKAIDEKRVNAQLVRRVEDRWLGFELSERLWRKFNNKTLSAGRVQMPVLRWIIERYLDFKKSWTVVFRVKLSNGSVIKLTGLKMDPLKVKNELEGSMIRILDISEDLVDRDPPPPFTTDAMLREASRLLHFSAVKTMRIAQTLFESGFITYHRTDSIRVSLDGINVAKDYIVNRFGQEVFKGRKWAPAEEGAHECIRPVKPMDARELMRLIREGLIRVKGITLDHIKLYDLIFRRFIASQMKKAKLKVQKTKISLKNIAEINHEAIIDVVEPGFTLISPIKLEPEITGKEKVISVMFRREPQILPYTQGEVINLMKERGIGRPSTYATIVQKLIDRGYVVERKGRLIPTTLGFKVHNYLTEKFGDILSERVTRDLERKMDMVERGADYQRILLEEYREIKSLS